MAAATFILEVRFSWWLMYFYLPGLRLFAWLVVEFINIDAVPNLEKINKVIKKGTRFYINGKLV